MFIFEPVCGGLSSLYGAFKCGPASEPLAPTLTLSSMTVPNCCQLVVTRTVTLLIFVIFLKIICSFLFDISRTFQNIVKIILNNIRLDFLFYRKSTHAVI